MTGGELTHPEVPSPAASSSLQHDRQQQQQQQQQQQPEVQGLDTDGFHSHYVEAGEVDQGLVDAQCYIQEAPCNHE